MSERTFSVPGISCDHCKAAIETTVSAVNGVDTVTIDIAAKTVRVTGSATETQLRAAIDDAGYQAADVRET